MGTRPEALALGIAADEVGRRRESFKVLGSQGNLSVSLLEVAVRIRPRPSGE